MTTNQKRVLEHMLLHPEKIVNYVFTRKLSRFIKDDELYLKILFKLETGKSLNLENPKTLNEKLQWLKLHYRKPEFVIMADKYAAKRYIASKIGEKHVIPLLGVWDRPEEIDFEKLPERFVLKCNHTSGIGLIICKDKSRLNRSTVINELNRGLKDNYYLRAREWPYKDIPRKIIAEEYKTDESGVELKDYKMYCFNGEPLFCQVDFGKAKGKMRSDFTRNLYDMEWHLLNMQFSHPNDISVEIPKPSLFEKMKEFARILSAGEPFLRVDFYYTGEEIFFSEITFYPIAGFGWFKPDVWNEELGKKLVLPQTGRENL